MARKKVRPVHLVVSISEIYARKNGIILLGNVHTGVSIDEKGKEHPFALKDTTARAFMTPSFATQLSRELLLSAHSIQRRKGRRVHHFSDDGEEEFITFPPPRPSEANALGIL
jgi:hypothetical protein